jgi:membrane associated rhomboid family serine protease
MYQDDLPCDPVEVIERTLNNNHNNHSDDEDDSAQQPNNAREKETNSKSERKNENPVQKVFNRLFFPERQSSTTSVESVRSSSGRDLENSRSRQSDTASSSTGSSSRQQYSMSELVASLGAEEGDVDLPPALERRVRDFKFAQAKRRERHGDQKPWGIYGLYAHLSDIRADLEWAEDAAYRRQRGQPYLSWRDFDKSRDKGLHNRPLFTYGVLALCTIMMFVTFGVNGWKFEPLNVNPLIGPSSETLIKCGARDTNLIVNEGQWFRLFTPMVLHAGLVHFVVNMMALYFIGGAVEQSHGFASAAVLFIIPGVGGNILSAICLPQYISVGASGGIFGLIGGCLADISLNWNLLFLKTTTDANTRLRHFYVLFWLGVDIVINCLLGFTPFVDNFTHLGGFMYGFCCGISTIERLALGFFGISKDSCSRLGSTFMRFFGLIISIIAIMVTTVVLVQSDGVSSPCHGCRYISCVPFPPAVEEKWW